MLWHSITFGCRTQAAQDIMHDQGFHPGMYGHPLWCRALLPGCTPLCHYAFQHVGFPWRSIDVPMWELYCTCIAPLLDRAQVDGRSFMIQWQQIYVPRGTTLIHHQCRAHTVLIRPRKPLLMVVQEIPPPLDGAGVSLPVHGCRTASSRQARSAPQLSFPFLEIVPRSCLYLREVLEARSRLVSQLVKGGDDTAFPENGPTTPIRMAYPRFPIQVVLPGVHHGTPTFIAKFKDMKAPTTAHESL